MSVFSRVLREFFLSRYVRVERAARRAVELQYSTLAQIVERGRYTSFGREWGLNRVRSAEQFARQVPRFDYGRFYSYIERMRRGEANVTCEERVEMFARSSGTAQRSKYIPLTRRALRQNHLRGMADAVAIYLSEHPASRLFEGRTLTLGGSCHREGGALVGDLSALLITAVGRWGELLRAPSRRVALIEDFDAKCDAIYEECRSERIVALAGVPSWNMALLRRVIELSGGRKVVDVWPDVELFMHGGVSFRPYRDAFADVMGREIEYHECYNASEGFIAIAERCGSDEMLLMPDYGCYYEFARGDNVVPLEGVRCGAEYAVLMTSVNGLWRYELGDRVRFTSVDPYRIQVVGRTKQYINAFGEELMIGNAEEALLRASFVTGAVVEEYTASPIVLPSAKGYHRWIVEFVHPPESLERFAEELDMTLRELNSDYDAKRRSVMSRAKVVEVPRGAFHRWQQQQARRKIPRLKNDSTVSDGVLSVAAMLQGRQPEGWQSDGWQSDGQQLGERQAEGQQHEERAELSVKG